MHRLIKYINPALGCLLERSVDELINPAWNAIYKQPPLTHVCKIVVGYGSTTPNEGTGVLVGPNLLLTAAHNLHDPNRPDRWAKDIRVACWAPFFQTWVMAGPPKGYVKDRDYFVNPNYKPRHGNSYNLIATDYAVVRLKGNKWPYVDERTVKPWGVETVKALVNKTGQALNYSYKFHNCGYPSSGLENRSGNANHLHVGVLGSASRLECNRLIIHESGSVGGFSGGGLFIEWWPDTPQSQFKLFGVHLGIYEGHAVARLFDRELSSFVKSHLRKKSPIDNRWNSINARNLA